MAKEILFKGRKPEELRALGLEDFSKLIPSTERRRIRRGFTDRQKKLLSDIKKDPEKFHKTHERDMVIIPEMLDANLGIHNGKEFVHIKIKPEMLGHRLGEFSMTRRRVKHSDPGAGATRGSKHVPLK
ncbi:30S ribosomal protein S19 [Candidatus Micrarchaeota archaeon RBG_16_49_10]|nr:small subunit ribosomal protein S19 [uncultured archaeon]OGI15363.1 MAG: 30S ribosomal protein S19 [Candidatus Micrarchaeota archaeon RBG_16_49_10]